MTISVAVFCPQSKAPSSLYLESIPSYIKSHSILRRIYKAFSTLPEVWTILVQQKPELASLTRAPRYTKILAQWLIEGDADAAASMKSSMVALPRLVIIQITQYFQFLESHGMTHANFLAQIQGAGGIQGYCGGFPTAVAIACAKDEKDLVDLACIAIQLAYAIGVFAELGDNSDISGTTTIVVRLKREGQAEELIQKFPNTYISAIADPRSVSIVGPVDQLVKLQAHANQQGLLVQCMDLQGKVHNPENADLAEELVMICHNEDLLDLPGIGSLQVPIRTNRTGDLITKGSLTEEVITTILTCRCEWFQLLSLVAVDLKRTGFDNHKVVSFGIGDCVSLMPFNKMGLKITKIDCSQQMSKRPSRLVNSSYEFPDDAIAIIGASHEEVKTDRFELQSAKSQRFYANFIDDPDRFDNRFFGINQREMTHMDPQQRILLELAYEATESSGYTRRHIRESGDSVGCFIGASFVEYLDNTSAHCPSAYTSTGTIRAFLCPAEVIDTACSSSLVAINRACKAIQTGECSMALAGGVNIITGANNFLDLAKAGFLSPTGQCKPFDKDADGYCRAEGAGLVVLKALGQAHLDGDHIMAVIPGAATNQGGLSCGITVPDSTAQMKLYRRVLQQAGISHEQITYVEAHGTGTQAGDPLEITSIRSIFGAAARLEELHLGSVKGNIGHCETAAGVVGLLKVISMLEHQAIPPQANHKTLNPSISALHPDRIAIARDIQPWNASLRIAMVNSYGAAGSNAAVLCCEGPRKTNLKDELSGPGTKQPIVISAASMSSLQNFRLSLASYLTKVAKKPTITEIGFTLGEKRQRHKYCLIFEAKDTEELVQTLSNDEAPAIERLPSSRPVVLAFGGQSAQIIGLDKGIYDHFKTFRMYINMCDDILQELGYPSILPAVFSSVNISDTVILQTGFVAIQYASALTWINAGLKVDTVVGHSLGELTALSVSGMLSIRDCLKLVAARANLMSKKWGQEKGAMLCIFGSRIQVEQLIAGYKFSKPDSFVEIACCNSSTTQVVSGDTTAITELQSDLTSRSSSFKCLRVDTSHGFHSRLVEPILNELDQVSATLEWNEPVLPIEICAPDPSSSIVPYNPSTLARNPVFFSDTVRRIEEKFGHCLWLEAGMNSLIISMVKRAISEPAGHVLHAIATNDRGVGADCISRTVSSLWRASVDVTHWSFLSEDHVGSHIWLPPYQFDVTTAWLPNIDRAAELQRQLHDAQAITMTESTPPQRKLLMVTLSHTGECGRKRRFEVAVGGERFRKLVGGHAVRHHPMSPASVYIECVAMAVGIWEGGLQEPNLEFQNLDIQSPLCLEAENVEVILDEVNAQITWDFSVISRDRVVHARGRVAKTPESKLETMVRLISKRMQFLEQNDDIDRMKSKRAYDLFSRVVTYDRFLRGIVNISMSDSEAVAEIIITADQPGQEESTVLNYYDAVTLDNFIQVVGLLMNTSDMVNETEVMICSGIGSSVFSKSCNMTDHRSWKVYASFIPTSQSQAIGDVFTFSKDSSVAVAFTECHFTKLDISRLERLLGLANRPVGDKQAQRLDPSNLAISVSGKTNGTLGVTLDDSNASPLDEIKTPDSLELNLREMLATYTGAAVPTIRDETLVTDLGLDSLAATELAEELQSAYEIAINGQDILSMSVTELENLLRRPTGSHFEECIPKQTTPTEGNSTLARKLNTLIVETTGALSSAITGQMTLEEVGVDSLALTEISIDEVLVAIGASHTSKFGSSGGFATPPKLERPQFSQLSSSPVNDDIRVKLDPKLGLEAANAQFENAARDRSFRDYCNEIAMEQDKLTLAYILEAFKTLNLDLSLLNEGDYVPNVNCVPKHSKLLQRLWDILEKHGVVTRDIVTIMRGSQPASSPPSSHLHEEFMKRHPAYAIEAQLMALTGPRLAECLEGKVDPIQLLFGTSKSAGILEQFYGQSPMLSTMTDQLVTFIIGCTDLTPGAKQATFRILEVGGRTGGTTARLAERLASFNVSVEYIFTDMSPTLVSKARRRFAQYSWMSFETLGLELPTPAHLRTRFDIIIGTNCVHATSDKVATTSRLREMLHDDGCLVLSEVTHIIDWYDIVFGMLDGWWLADGGSSYPLQSAEAWMTTFQKAGFSSGMFSEGDSDDSNIQQLLIGCSREINRPPDGNFMQPAAMSYQRHTVIYKEVDGVQIEADIFLPKRPPKVNMPIALLLHGGGHMTLSKRAIRPAQTAHLLANDILPISLDYRLCPEINVIDGAMTDVRDAFSWIRNTLPSLADSKGLTVDTERIVVIGWSTGGHLAMSTAWTVDKTPPKAILSFYAPTDFQSPEAFTPSYGSPVPHRALKQHILEANLSKTISKHDIISGDASELEWMNPSDLRSDILLSLFFESKEYGMCLLLNGKQGTSETVASLLSQPPSKERQAAICPTARVQAGEYNVPTYIIHGTLDDTASFEAASKFQKELGLKGVKSGFTALKNGNHLFDLNLKPGMAAWDQQVAPGYQFLFDALEV
ncbi:hypothetical protein BDV26DRAFT_300248 [Aspergillus bertholletiae]|uniref:Polyketide synthase n=1 Tax=Aspergillus bertholletiae TaxID=1226010 RepID=A0A5N7AWZ4_9EURO|nr:hypothetical protein BDV26DRAFT_300248 [Aspergillus bertholletiae]